MSKATCICCGCNPCIREIARASESSVERLVGCDCHPRNYKPHFVMDGWECVLCDAVKTTSDVERKRPTDGVYSQKFEDAYARLMNSIKGLPKVDAAGNNEKNTKGLLYRICVGFSK